MKELKERLFNSVANIIALACLIKTCSSAANYLCDMNGHSKELETLKLDFTKDIYKMPADVHEICDHLVWTKMLN